MTTSVLSASTYAKQ